MQTEIERKFLTTSSLFKEQAVRVMDIHQGYIGTTSKGEARVSIRDEKAWVIVKSNERLSRLEYEIPIPKKDDFIEVTEWTNGEGWDITINDRVIPLTRGELDAIDYLTKGLDYDND